MRAALGASRVRLLRQSLVEQGVLAVLGTAAGCLAALFVLDAFVALAPPAIPHLDMLAIDGRVFGYMGLVAVAVMLLTGAAPAWRASRADATGALRTAAIDGRTGAAGRGLVVAELALAVMLVAGAGLMVRTMVHLHRVDLGFEPGGVVATELSLPMARMIDGPLVVGVRPAWDRLVLLYDDVVQQAATVPGVRGAALVSSPPRSSGDAVWFVRQGIAPPRADGSPDWRPVQRRVITPGYFDVLRVPLVKGRRFTREDEALEFLRTGAGRRRGAAIVNQEAARRLFPGEDPLGQTLTIDGDSRVDGRLVVGIAGDARDEAPDVPAAPVVYIPLAEAPSFSATLLARASGSVMPGAGLRARLRATDAALTIGEIRSLGDSYAATLAPRRFTTLVLMLFAGVGLAVAAVGLYGLMALLVARRTREIGIRIALGASWPQIRRLVFREAGLIVAFGLTLGLAGAAAATTTLRGLVFGVGRGDGVTWVATVLLLTAAGLVAAWLPARRAAHIEPVRALRQE